MFSIREGKSLKQGERVEVYYNIHKGGFSIKSLDKSNPDKGKVVAYSSEVELDNATFHMNENALRKILDEKRKRVYAVVRGYFNGNQIGELEDYKELYINPYTCPNFTIKDTDQKPEKAEKVAFWEKSCGVKGEIQQ